MRTNQLSLLDAPSTRSSTPTPVVPSPGRDTPQRRYLGLTRNSLPRSFWGLHGTRANEEGAHPNVVATSSSRRAHSLNVGGCSHRSSAKRISMQHHNI